MKRKIEVCECGPRDGWQNLRQILSFEEKTTLIDRLVETGIHTIEFGSFVSPKAIPQMADVSKLATYCLHKYPDVKFIALAPNFLGAQNAYHAGVRNITYVISLSESHNKANINRTHQQSFEELETIFDTFPDLHVSIGYATAFGCPFEGIPEISYVVEFAKKLYQIGVKDLTVSDTIGIADPQQTRDTIQALQKALPDCHLQVHIHDTRGMGIASTLAAIECGVDTVQSTLGGLGGCPFAPGAAGNVATEDLVYMLERMGYETGVNFSKLLDLSKYQKSFVQGMYSGHHMNISDSLHCTLV